MSLSRHSSTEALTSSNRGSEKDSDIEPEKSSIGEISARTSSRPPTGFSYPASIRRWNQASLPPSHSKDWICRSRRSGTSRGSRIFAKVTRVGAPGKFGLAETAAMGAAGEVVALDEAKMRPSENCALVWRARSPRATVAPIDPGGRSGSTDATDAGSEARRLLSWRGLRPDPRVGSGETDSRPGPPCAHAKLDEGSAKRQSSCKCSRCRGGTPKRPPRPKSDLAAASRQDATRR